MTHEVATVLCGGPGLQAPYDQPVSFIDNKDNAISPCVAYQQLLERCSADVIIYIHDDVSIHEDGWLMNVLDLFEHMDATVVGLGGALGLGNHDLYRKPYSIWNLARRGYMSNQTDAEVHGARERGWKQVAVVEQFFMAVRTDWLKARKTYNYKTQQYVFGWPTPRLTHHCMDMWLACEAERSGAKTFMVGIDCTHHGGGSSTTESYAKAPWLQGGSMESDHQLPHQWIWNEYRDVLPLEINT